MRHVSTTTFLKAGRSLTAGVALLLLAGCIGASWVGRRIVHPPVNAKADALMHRFAKPFYTQRIVLRVAAPDPGTIVASVIEPARYDFKITVNYRAAKTRGAELEWTLPRISFVPRDTATLKPVAKRRILWKALRDWLATLKPEAPVGTILMLPPFGFNKNSLLPWALFFADRGWRVVVVDLRGQGASRSRYLTWGLRDRHDLHRLIRVLKHRRLLAPPWLYFGISYGAGVALMAAAGPPWPAGVIAVSPWASAREVIALGGHRWGNRWVGWLAPGVHSPTWAKAEKIAGRLAGIDLARAMPIRSVPSIRAPVLYLGGLSDRVAPPAEMRALARNTPRATLVLLPGLTHTVSTTIGRPCRTLGFGLVGPKP